MAFVGSGARLCSIPDFLSAYIEPPRRVSHTLAGRLFMVLLVRISPQKWELSTFPTSYPQVGGSQLLGAGLGGGLAAVGV